MPRVLVVNGPNLNRLGQRKPEVYGSTSLPELEQLVDRWAVELGWEAAVFQANMEGALVERLQAADFDGVVINPGAFGHYSRALHDAISDLEAPAVEVHISNVRGREPWRHQSVIAPACVRSIYGRGISGYHWAIRHLHWRQSWPVEEVAYGPHPDQVGDLRHPQQDTGWGVAVLFHGGFWRHPWGRDTLDGWAVDLARRGYTTWNVEYRRLGAGGGWPSTFLDVAAATDWVARLDEGQVTVSGHSAGGQLALWVAGRGQLPESSVGARAQVRATTAIGVAPVADLAGATAAGIGGESTAMFVRSIGPYIGMASPRALLPLGVRQVLAVAEDDDVIPPSYVSAYAEAAREAGDEVSEVDQGGGHFGVLDPNADPWRKLLEAGWGV